MTAAGYSIYRKRPDRPPIVCSQAAVARFLGRSANASGLLDILVTEEIVEYYRNRGCT
jgi:hypothetical protein